MKKILKGIMCTFLAGACAIPATACNEKSSSPTNKTDAPVESATSDYVGPGIHTDNTKETDSYILKNGSSQYKIVIPADASDYEVKAGELIETWLETATGFAFPLVTDAQIFSDDQHVISVGDTRFMQESGIPIEFSQLEYDGYKLVTKGKRIFISGSQNAMCAGTYYGAQDFLEHMIDWVPYTSADVSYTRRKTLKLYDFDVTEVPDFSDRNLMLGNLTYDETWIDYARLSNNSEKWLPLDGHSHFVILPPAEYAAEHPKWYTVEYTGQSNYATKAQLCLSQEDMIEQFSQNLADMFKKYPNASYAHLGIMDNSVGCCSCDDCKHAMEENNTTYSGLNMIFMNKVARRTTELVQQTEPDRQLYFRTFAYFYTETPPVNKDGSIHSDAVIPDDNVIIQFTPLSYNASETIDDELNKTTKERFDNWSILTKNISVYQYCSNFRAYYANHPNWNSVVANFRYYAENGVQILIDQGGGSMQVPLIEMRIFIESRLMWDLSLSWQELAEEFIAYYYGPVADDVQRAYDLMTSYTVYAKEVLGMTGTVYLLLDDAKWWEFSYVESFRRIMSEALEKLENSSQEIYDKYYYRTAGVYLENMFLQLDLYMSEYTKEHNAETIDLFEATASYYGMDLMAEAQYPTVSEYIVKWKDANV